MRAIALAASIVWLMLASSLATAQPPGNAEVTYDPPAFSFEQGHIELLEAVRLTLQHDPNLLLAREDSRAKYGLALELSGFFDWTMNGSLSWEHREQELLESIKQAETDKRNQFRDGQFVACELRDDLTNDLATLQQARNQTPNGANIPLTSLDGDKAFEAQLRILEAVIISSTPAQRNALLGERAAIIDAQIAFIQNRGLPEVQQACDRTTEALARLGDEPEEEEFDLGRLQLQFDKLYRNGFFLSPFLKGAYNSTGYIGKEDGFFVTDTDPFGVPRRSPSGIPLDRLIDFGGKNVQDTYTFEVGFEANMPLLRGRGIATSGPVDAADIDYEASRLLVEHTASESVLSTALAYWSLVAAEERAAVLDNAVTLQSDLAQITRDLIEGDAIPGADLSRALAGEANSRAQYQSSAADLVSAQLALVRSMGVTVSGPENLPSAQTGFPEPPTIEAVRQIAETALTQGALEARLDLQAARAVIESGKLLADAALIDLRPRLDIGFGASTITRGEGSFSESTDRFAAPSWKVSATFEKPFRNRSARGLLLQRQAQANQLQISAGDLDRLVRVGVVQTLGSLLEALEGLRWAEAAANSAEETINSEVEKLRLGETTLLDTILTEQQRTSSQLALISARQQVASLITRLRFETGTLVQETGSGRRVTPTTLTTVPTGADS